MKKIAKKLTLKKETIKALEVGALRHVVGGVTAAPPYCMSESCVLQCHTSNCLTRDLSCPFGSCGETCGCGNGTFGC